MSGPALEKFGFDTVFDGSGGVTRSAPRPKRYFNAEEVEAIRAQAFAEGERKALGDMGALQARALSDIARSAEQALGGLARIAHAHREGSAALALACARAIAGELLEMFPKAALQKGLESLAREIESEPRLLVTVAPGLGEGLQELLAATAAAGGFNGQILVREDHLAQARLLLNAKGVKVAQPAGYELFDKEEPLGTSQFVQDVRLKRSLEGELARTVMALKGVQHARVHLAQEENSSFVVSKRAPSKASVMLQLEPGYTLTHEQAAHWP